MDDAVWMCNAPIHYCDLPSVANEDDSEQADDYFFSKMNDDTVYYEPTAEEQQEEKALQEEQDTVSEQWTQEVAPVREDIEHFPVIRRRSRSVGSRPLFLRKPEPQGDQQSRGRKPAAVKPGKCIDDPDHHFVDGLRTYSQQPKSKGFEPPKTTKPMPFNLTKPKKKPVQNSASCNPSLAEGVQKWEKKTPERFHSSRHGEVYRSHEKFEIRGPTLAHTPQLTAFKRHRPVHALSREAIEQKEVDEMKKHQFKAHDVNDKVFKAPILPPKKELKPTKVEPFHITESHKKENIAPEVNKNEEYHFHAKPAPKFDAPVAESRHPQPVTVPQTPKFSAAGKAAIQSWRRQRSHSNGSLSSSLRSGGSNGSISSSTTSERLKNTVIAPFSFEDRDKALQRKKELKIKKVLEEERKQREFHANPCPNFSAPSVPERSTFVATRAVPFKLSCETIGQSKKEKFIQQLEEMRLEERKATQFKAHPAKILAKEPFKVKLEHASSVEVAEFNLSTTKRAAERKEWEQYLKEREAEKEAARLRREQERLEREAEEAARIREEASFHAQPIRQYKPIEIKKADTELVTVPQTPKFMKK